MNLSGHLKRLMGDWFITKDIVDIKDNASEGIILINAIVLFNYHLITFIY